MKTTQQPNKPHIVILTPVFNEEDSLDIYFQQVKEHLIDQPDYDFSVLFIEDGSKDKSWSIIQKICRLDSHFQGIRLS